MNVDQEENQRSKFNKKGNHTNHIIGKFLKFKAKVIPSKGAEKGNSMYTEQE